MNAEEFFYSQTVKIIDMQDFAIIEKLQEFARLKCKEQREICSENAQLKVVEVVVHEDRFFIDTEHYDVVDIDSILNSEEPEL